MTNLFRYGSHALVNFLAKVPEFCLVLLQLRGLQMIDFLLWMKGIELCVVLFITKLQEKFSETKQQTGIHLING